MIIGYLDPQGSLPKPTCVARVPITSRFGNTHLKTYKTGFYRLFC